MDSVICPNCDTVLSENEPACPQCGWVNSDVVNNADEISKLFASSEIGDKITLPEEEAVVKGSEEISPEQIAAFESGQPLEFIPGIEPESETKSETENKGDEMFNLDDFKDMGFPIPDELNDDGKSKKQKKLAFLKRIILTALIAVVAFVMGGLSLLLYNRFSYIDDTYDIGRNAISVVSGKIPSGCGFKATDIYIKPGAEITHCIVYGELITSVGERSVTYYRLEINNASPEKTVLFYAFDEAEYNRLKDGGDEDRIKASLMKSYYDNYMRYVSEINSGDKAWKKANTDYINLTR